MERDLMWKSEVNSNFLVGWNAYRSEVYYHVDYTNINHEDGNAQKYWKE